jgi:hypothetical protein
MRFIMARSPSRQDEAESALIPCEVNGVIENSTAKAHQ